MRKTLVLHLFGHPRLLLLAGLMLFSQLSFAQWNASIGTQSTDLGRQGLAFLPGELWILAGDSVTWTMATDEPHTLTFLKAGQVRLPFSVGCPGYSVSPATFDGSACVSTPPLGKGQTFSVTFPAAGNFKLVCLFHGNMTASVHVLDSSQPLPHDQAFYDREARAEGRALLSDRDEMESMEDESPGVTVGGGEVTATGGGSSTLALMRFTRHDVTIHVGDTVEWTNVDPVTPHTVTFGTEPANLIPPSPNVSVDADGTRHATLTSPSDSANSGFIVAAPQDRIGLPQAPPGTTRFRVTFTGPGSYPYICGLHDGLGMSGTVHVVP